MWREDRALGAADRLAGLERGLDPRGRGDDEPVVVAEHDVARARRRAPPKRTARPGAARETVVPERGSVPRAKAGRPSARSPRDVAAEAVGDDPRQPAALGLGREQLAEHRARPPSVGDHQHVAGRGASASALITGRWSSCGHAP